MIVPVVLSGGSGTRLWPPSRKSYPAQFVPLPGEETLFQGSARAGQTVTFGITPARPETGYGCVEFFAPPDTSGAPDTSIDFAVMERASDLSAVPFAGAWSDLGGWDAVWSAETPDGAGVVTAGAASAIDCRDSQLRSESEGHELVGIGLTNVVAVAMNDAVLVADKARAQDVKRVVDLRNARKATQAVPFPKDHRPWGWFETQVLGPRFQLKRIVVHPGAGLSLQSHHHRSEHWIVLQGTAKETVDETVKLPMELIEVQTGTYLGKDDIIRNDDVYARRQGEKG